MIIMNLKAKKCMSHLLLASTFDSFSLISGEITTFNKFTIDGFIRRDFFEDVPEEDYSRWGEVRELCFNIIRGKRTPLGFKIILSLPRKDFADFLRQADITAFSAEEIQGLYLNFKYDGINLQCVTGISMQTFTMDKTLEQAWDRHVRKFFAAAGIEFDEISS